MKKLYFLILCIIAGTVHGQWIKLPKQTNYSYNQISFPDANHGWVGGNNNNNVQPIYTKDGGKTWNTLNDSKIGSSTTFIYFPSIEEGYISSAITRATYETLDSGKTWAVIGSSRDNKIYEIVDYIKKFKNKTYVAIGNSFSNKNLYLMDSLFNMKVRYCSAEISKLFFCDTINGYAEQGNNIIKTIDGGRSWNALGTGINSTILALYFTDVNHGVGVGLDATILYTNDGGLNWKVARDLSGGFRYNDVVFTTPAIGYICGQQGTILKTTDGGLSWQPMKSGTFENLHKFSFPDSTVGYCVGDNGTVLKLIEDLTVPQVSKITVPTGKLCAGGSYAVGYVANKKFKNNNTFTAYLSDGLGDFTNAVHIGKLASDTSGFMNITIPTNTPRNLGYRIRLESDSPVGTSAANDGFIEIQPSVTPTILIATAQTNVCEGTEVIVTTKITNGGNAPKVNWYNGNQLVSNLATLKAAPKDKEKYWARVKSNAVCATPDSAMSNTIVFAVTTPALPTITAQGSTLTSSVTTGNQWYKGSEMIPLASAQTYKVLENGLYKVAVNDGVCPLQFSKDANVIILDNEVAGEVSSALNIFPNPTNNILSIHTTLQIARLVICQSNGTKALESKATENLDVSALPEGLYLLEAIDMDGKRVVKKFEKR